jgi:hypothetical protein
MGSLRNMEIFELAPDGHQSIEMYRSLEAAVERARARMSSSSASTPPPGAGTASWGR